jgi:acyl-CoA thioesterase FadM
MVIPPGAARGAVGSVLQRDPAIRMEERLLEYTLRLVANVTRSSLRGRLGALDESVLTMRVWPTDLDTNGHMNNGRYLTLMDFGRTDLLIRAGLARQALRRRWVPALGGATVVFRRSLRPMRLYELRTRVVCWDDKWFYFEQRFDRHGATYAHALARGLLLERGVKVPPSEAVLAMGGPAQSPPMSDAVRAWNAAETVLRSS